MKEKIQYLCVCRLSVSLFKNMQHEPIPQQNHQRLHYRVKLPLPLRVPRILRTRPDLLRVVQQLLQINILLLIQFWSPLSAFSV